MKLDLISERFSQALEARMPRPVDGLATTFAVWAAAELQRLAAVRLGTISTGFGQLVAPPRA